MKIITLYRSDFRKTAEADFFEDILQALGEPKENWDSYDSIDIKVESFELIKF
jgi:hypothetical protein